MPAPTGRAAANAVKDAEKLAQAQALAERVTVAETPTPLAEDAPAPPSQRVILGYRLMKTFSDVSVRPHRIVRAGEIIKKKSEVERLARLGAMLEPVEKEAKPAVAAKDAGAGK